MEQYVALCGEFYKEQYKFPYEATRKVPINIYTAFCEAPCQAGKVQCEARCGVPYKEQHEVPCEALYKARRARHKTIFLLDSIRIIISMLSNS